jgi:biopolymer transport protein ExbB
MAGSVFSRNRLVMVAAAATALLATAAFAQDPKAAPAGGDGGGLSKGGVPDNIIDLIVAGGTLNIAFMVVIGSFSLYSFAILFERLVNTRQSKITPRPLVAGLEELITKVESSTQPYKLLCEKYPSPLANIVNSAMARSGRPWPEVEKALEDSTSAEIGNLRQKIAGLGTAAAVSTLLGLFGTVIGMVQAFQMVSSVGTGKTEALAKGIYLALETTVAGLGVAIPALLIQQWLRGRNFKIGNRLSEIVGGLLPCFLRMERWEQRKRETDGRSSASAVAERPAGIAAPVSTSAEMEAQPVEEPVHERREHRVVVGDTGQSDPFAELKTASQQSAEIDVAEVVEETKKPKIPAGRPAAPRGR